MVGAVAGDATLGLGLREAGRVTDEVAEDGGCYGRCCKWIRLRRRNRAWAVGTLLSRDFKLRIVAHDQLAALVHAHQAVVLAMTPAARGQSGLCVLSHGQHRKQEREAAHGPQQNGDKPTQ